MGIAGEKSILGCCSFNKSNAPSKNINARLLSADRYHNAKISSAPVIVENAFGGETNIS